MFQETLISLSKWESSLLMTVSPIKDFRWIETWKKTKTVSLTFQQVQFLERRCWSIGVGKVLLSEKMSISEMICSPGGKLARTPILTNSVPGLWDLCLSNSMSNRSKRSLKITQRCQLVSKFLRWLHCPRAWSQSASSWREKSKVKS